MKQPMTDTTYETYYHALLDLSSNFQERIDLINAHSKLLTLYHLHSELIISCPSEKNVLLIQLVESANKSFPYKLKFIVNDIEKATFSFNSQSREKGIWFELNYLSGITYSTTQEIVRYWIPKVLKKHIKLPDRIFK